VDGNVVEATLGASTDTFTHCYMYSHRPDVMGIIHTHSNYATAFAALGKPIPACLTAMADEFGGPVPCAGYARIGGDRIGEEALRCIGSSVAVLMRQHGVFTIGGSVEKALKAAVMVEDVAKTVWLAMQMGEVQELPSEEIAANFDRYQNRYGTAAASQG
jgi:L-ribulose-5-phosphate 4-epimerase